jgi:broad specificity phosphatase PhoE
MKSSRTMFYLVRHGETDWNATERCQGALDIPMNETGLRQARLAGEALRHVSFDAAYTSTLSRAQLTAAAVVEGSALEATPVAAFAELSYGAWHGLRPDEWPHETGARWRADPWAIEFPDGESLVQLRARVIPEFTRIAKEHEGGTVLIASHGHVNRIIMLHALGADPNGFWDIAQPNGCVVELTLANVDEMSAGAVVRQLFPLVAPSTAASVSG